MFCFQLFEFQTRLIPRVCNWDCSKELWGMGSWTTFGHYKITDSYLSMTPFFLYKFVVLPTGESMPSWTVVFLCFLQNLVPWFYIETNFLTPIEKHLFDGTSGPAFYRAKSSMFAAFHRLMALHSIELTPCFWTLFLYHSQFYGVKKRPFFATPIFAQII